MSNESASGFELYIKSPEGFELAYRVALVDTPEGTTLADNLINTCAHLAAAGYVRSERLDKPARGGGGGNPNWKPQQPEQAAPDAQVPRHCDQPMKYRKWEKDGKTFEKYECRASKESCPQGGQYPHSVWRDQWVKKLNAANGQENPFQEQVQFE